MSTPLQLIINFDNPQRVFYAGETIHAKLFLNCQAIECRKVYVKWKGKAKVAFSERRTRTVTRNGRTETETYYVQRRSYEKYFENTFILWGTGQAAILPAGNHVFPLSFLLPQTLPSSFKGTYGGVEYTCKGKIDLPWKFDPYCTIPFTIISIVDLNVIPMAGSKIGIEDQKTICCLCCESGPIKATVTLRKKGYVPGEPIFVDAKIVNRSNRGIAGTTARLSSKTIFRAEGAFKRIDSELASIKSGRIAPGETCIWNSEKLCNVPPVAPSNLAGCSIIDIIYQVQLEVDPEGPAFDLDLPIEILIGTIPLRSTFETFNTQPSAPPLLLVNTDAIPANQSSSEPPAYGFQLPPSYAELYPDLPPFTYQNHTGEVRHQLVDDSGNKSTYDPQENEEYGKLDYNPQYPTFTHRYS